MLEYELEALPELVRSYEWELEAESELEGEEFFRRLAGLARRAAQSPALRRVALSAARSALRGLGDVGGAIGGQAGPRGAALGRDLGGALGRNIASWLPQSELEAELEGEFEGELEGELNPLQRVYPAALMEHLGHAAAEAEREEEAEAFLSALIPLAAQVLPRVAPVVTRTAPQLIRGVARVGRTLLRNPATRPLVRTVPTIVRQTAATLAQQAAQGQPLT